MSDGGFSLGTALVAGLIGAVGGPAIVNLGALLFFRLRAPFQLDHERKADLDAERLAGRNAAAVANERIAALEKPRPVIEVIGERQGRDMFLRVHNLSAIASFWATIENADGLMMDWPTHDVFARWNHQSAIRTQIPKSGHHRLYVGRLEVRDMGGVWYVPFTSEQEPPAEARAMYHFLYGTDRRDTVMNSAVEFCVTIYADPDLDSPIRKYVLLAGGWAEVQDWPIMGSGREPWVLEQLERQLRTTAEQPSGGE
jgi:hypothetical protein